MEENNKEIKGPSENHHPVSEHRESSHIGYKDGQERSVVFLDRVPLPFLGLKPPSPETLNVLKKHQLELVVELSRKIAGWC